MGRMRGAGRSAGPQACHRERVMCAGRALRPAVCAALVVMSAGWPARALAQTTMATSPPTTDWRRFPTVAADVASRWQPSAETAVAPVITGTGPALQVQTIAAATLLRTDWTLSGTYAAGATFTPAPDVAPTEFGVVVGSGALACIVAPDGTARFEAHGSTLSVGSITAARTATVILVRVSDKAVTCVVNGQAAVTLAPMALNGAPGIYVGRSGSVLVAGFTTETAPNATGGR